MSNVILSFCIPTYNRPERIYKIIEQILPFKSEEIEVVISDDNPLDNRTQNIVKEIKDPRVMYFRNKKNLGYDANFLISIKRAKGDFVFLLVDEDDIEMETIPWILTTIKLNRNFTQVRGTIGDKRPGRNIPYYKLENKVLNRGSEYFIELFNYSVHASGIVLKKDALNLNKAKKYVGFLFIQQELVAQAMIAGDTLCSSKTFACVGKDVYKSAQPLFKGKGYWHPVISLDIIKIRIQIIYDYAKNFENKKRIINHFLEKEIPLIYFCLSESPFYESFKIFKSLKAFINGLFIIITMKEISRSPKFWINLIIKLLSKFKLALKKV